MGWFSKPKQMRPIVRMCGTKPEWARLQIERRRNEALKLVAPPVQQGMLAILGDKRRIDPIKYLRTELACTLVDAKDIIDTIDSWWPSGLSTVTGAVIDLELRSFVAA